MQASGRIEPQFTETRVPERRQSYCRQHSDILRHSGLESPSFEIAMRSTDYAGRSHVTDFGHIASCGKPEKHCQTQGQTCKETNESLVMTPEAVTNLPPIKFTCKRPALFNRATAQRRASQVVVRHRDTHQ